MVFSGFTNSIVMIGEMDSAFDLQKGARDNNTHAQSYRSPDRRLRHVALLYHNRYSRTFPNCFT